MLYEKNNISLDPVYFMAEQANIFGALTINEDLIFFDPYYNDQNKNIIKNQGHGNNLLIYNSFVKLSNNLYWRYFRG